LNREMALSRLRVRPSSLAEPVLLHVAEESEHLLALALELRGVDAGVAGVELDLDGLLRLGRQFGEHGVLGAAPHQRGDAAAVIVVEGHGLLQ